MRAFIVAAVALTTAACSGSGSSPSTPTPPPTSPPPVVIRRADLTVISEPIDGQLLPDGSYAFELRARNAGPDCAARISGTTAAIDSTGAQLAAPTWSLDAARIIRPDETFAFQFTLSAAHAFAAAKTNTTFRSDAIACP